MVHALEEIHRLLRPAGSLIEIHPAADAPPFVEVRSNASTAFREDDPVFDYEDDLRHADAAVASVIERGVFTLHERRRFQLRTYASSVKEMRDHWAFVGAYDPEEPEVELARRRDEMDARAAAALERGTADAELIYVEPALMSRLTPVPFAAGRPAARRRAGAAGSADTSPSGPSP